MAAESTVCSLPRTRCQFAWLALALDPQLLQDRHHRAPVGEGRLQQVQSDEAGEQEPVGRVTISEQDAREDEEPRDSSQVFLNHLTMPPNLKSYVLTRHLRASGTARPTCFTARGWGAFIACRFPLAPFVRTAYNTPRIEIVSPKSMEIIDTGDPGFWGEFLTQQRIKHFQA